MNFSTSKKRILNWRRRISRFAVGQEGAVAIEHAVLVAVVLGGMLIGISMLGDATSESLQKIANLDQAEDAYAFSANATEAESAGVEQAVQMLARQAQLWRWGTLLSLSAVGVAAGYCLHLRRRPKQQEEEEQEEEPVEEVDSLMRKRQGIYGILANDVGKLLHSRLLVEHVMSNKLATVLPSATRTQVASMMNEQSVRHLLVCDKKRKLLGIISDRDVLRGTGETAAQIMTNNPITLTPDTPISPAVTLLINRRISCLPVCENGELVGVMTTTDMLMVLQCALQALQKVAAEVDEDFLPASSERTTLAQPATKSAGQHFASTQA